MNVYLGMLLIDRIQSPKAYRSAIKQTQHFLALHTTHIKVLQTQQLLTIRPLYNNDQFTIVKDCNFVHTASYRLTMQENPPEAQLDFFQVCMECLLILKEHFPSKLDIQLQAENQNLRVRLEAMTEGNKAELSRRYLGNLRVMVDRADDLSKDELDDVLYLLRTEHSLKLKSLAITLISHMNEQLYLYLKEIDVEVIDQLANHDEFSKVASLVLARLVRAKTMTVRESRMNREEAMVKFDQPNLLKSHLFQLKESNNLERIAFLVDKLVGHIGQLDSEELLKVDSGISETIAKQLAGKYPVNGRSLLSYTIAVLRYSMQRRTTKNLTSLIQLINQAMDQPQARNGGQLKRTIQEFIGQFGDRFGQRQSRQLGQLMQKQQNLNLQSSRQTSRSVRPQHIKSTYVAQ